MNELQSAFNEYIDEVKKLNTFEKRSELIYSIKELIAVFEQLAINDNIDLHYLKNKEITDLNNSNVSEDDFLEASLVYLEVAKNVIGEYLSKKY